MENLATASTKKIKLKRFVVFLLILVALAGVGGSYYFYQKYTALKANPEAVAKKETDALVAEVAKLMELPKDEAPTVAVISDKEKLKDQVFFNAAQNGDVLLAYTTAMKAILYRPSTNKIVNVAPISINESQDLSQGTKSKATSSKK